MQSILFFVFSIIFFIIGICQLKAGFCIFRQYIKRSESPIYYWLEVTAHFIISIFWAYIAMSKL
jgi:hypothetical protein